MEHSEHAALPRLVISACSQHSKHCHVLWLPETAGWSLLRAKVCVYAIRFDIRDFRDSQDARSGQPVNRPRSPQQNGSTPSVDPALATVNGVPAAAKGPAKKLRGKKRGEEEEEGKGKGKSKGRGRLSSASLLCIQ